VIGSAWSKVFGRPKRLLDEMIAKPITATRIPTYVFESDTAVAAHVANLIMHTIQEQNAVGRLAVIGLAVGSPMKGVCQELVRLYREGELDFSRVVLVGLDEYYGLGADRLQSHARWLREHLIDQVNLRPQNAHLLDGTVPAERIEDYCRQFEDTLRRFGGLDLQVLWLARNGRIGGNEPFGVRSSRTRLATLDPITRREAAADFFQEENVPLQKLTLGLETLISARKILLIAFGEELAKVVRAIAEGPITEGVPASFLQEHSDAAFLMDEAAAADLTAVSTPWVLGTVEWTDPLIKRAVLWLSQQTGKALLKLDGDDFRNHNLHQLLRHHGPAQKLAHRVFRWMMDTIEYHPAGREPARILIFSPHPDDDVISMGGTMLRLVEDGHEVHVAYMVSGNIAVFDHDVQQLADLVAEINRRFDIDQQKSKELEAKVAEALARKKPGEPDCEVVLHLKELIRWSEAKAAATVCGCREEHLHFLDLPFYRTGTISKKAPGSEDVELIRQCVESVNPKQVYVAGDLSDPHGTHRVCAKLIFEALQQIEKSTGSRPEVLLYRGAWQEWAPHAIDLAVPLSPRDLKVKKEAIFRHESQKDTALFPGPDDPREFWQRAEDRNRQTADLYNQFGLPEYYALEAFRKWDGRPV